MAFVGVIAAVPVRISVSTEILILPANFSHLKRRSWKHARHSYMIHGHIHADTNADFWPLIRCRDNVLNAGVDLNGYHPVTFDELVENNRKFKAAHEEE